MMVTFQATPARLRPMIVEISTATKSVWTGLDSLRAGVLARVAEAEAELRAAAR